MNIEQAKENISIKEVLDHYNLEPKRVRNNDAFYYALTREENTPSLHISFSKNVGYDHGIGKGYDIISIVQEIEKCNVSEALKILSRISDTFSFQKQRNHKNEKIAHERKERKPYYGNF